MPLCQPAVVLNSKLQWISIKQDEHFAIQECKIVGGLLSWWSSGEVSWAYRVIIAATETQIAYAGDITQIVSDWECVQKLISEEPPLDPEASPSDSAAVLERLLKQHWEAKQGKEKTEGEDEENEKGKEKEKDSKGRSSSSRIFFRSSSSAVGIKPPTTGSAIVKRPAAVATSESPFPGIPLHREDGLQPVTPRSHSRTSPLPRPVGYPAAASSNSSNNSESENEGDEKGCAKGTTAASDAEAAVQNNEETGRERELREKFERSLDALEKVAAAPSLLQHNDDHYRVYVDCINGLLYELRAVKNGGSAQQAMATTTTTTVTAEMLCLLSRTSLDAARMMVAQQQAAHARKLAAAEANRSAPAAGAEAAAAAADEQKAKEGQGDTEPGSGDTERPLEPAVEEAVSQAEAAEVEKKKKADEDAKKRLQRCMDLFATANKSLASMTQPNGLTQE